MIAGRNEWRDIASGTEDLGATMGVFRTDGGRNTTSGANYSASPSSGAGPMVHRPRTFNEAVANAQTASDKALKTKKPEDFALADASWQIVQDWEEDEYRKASQSANPQKATSDLDHKYEVILRGDSIQAKIFRQITADAKKTVETESPAERAFQIKLYGEQAKVDEAYEQLQNAPADKKSEAFTKYMTAVKNVINLQIDHELSKLPAGPNGSHTLAQWKQAAGKVKELNQADPQTALIIDKMAEVRGYLDALKNDPDSLNLTPAEKGLAKKDPVTLAFVKAAGLTLDPNDPKLSPEMKQIAKDDPVLFTLLQLSKIEITTNSTPVVADSPIGQLGNGLYIHVKVNGKEITDPTLLGEIVKVYNGTEQKDRAVSVGSVLFSKLNIKSDQLDALMIAADNGRTQYATEHMKTLMGGSNPDLKAAVSFLNTQLNGFFDPGARAAFWETSGKPYITQDRFRQKFLELIKKPDPTSTDIKDIQALNSTETNADKVGKYIQDLLKDAPREVADVVLDAVKSTFNPDFYKSNKHDMGNWTPRFHDFYKALSMAVELSPGRAQEMVQWLMDRNAVQGGMIYQLWDSGNRRFEGVKDTIEDGFGLTLSQTFLKEVQKNREFQNMEYDLNMQFGQGWDKVQDKYAKKIYKQDYKEFMSNPDKFLEPFFQSFLKDKNIGRLVKITSDVQLRNIVGKILGITPTNTKVATELDYSKEWFAGSTEWETIILATKMIRDRGGDDLTITALPLKYVSQLHGVNTGALILVGDPDSDQEVIDLTAARNATLMNGGRKVNLGDVKDQWHFDGLQAFKDDNHYDDDGYIFLPKDLHLMDRDGDGKIESQDWERIDAAVTTWDEHAQTIGLTALAVTGTVLLFIPGANVVGAGILLGTAALGATASGYQIYKMASNGADVSWSNEQARFHYMNIAGTLLTFGRLGILTRFTNSSWKLAPYMLGAGNVMGFGGTVIGFTQMSQQAQLLAHNWDTMDWIDRTTSFAAIGSGATTMILSGVQPRSNVFKNPVEDSGATRVARPHQTGRKASDFWVGNNSPKGGLVAALWTRAKTQLDARVTKAWDKQAGEAWWADAIEAKAQQLAGPGKPVTDVHRADAKANHKDAIALDAFTRWRDDHNSPKQGPSAMLWTKAQKRYDREVGWGGWRLWSAEQRFMKTIGAPAYNAFKAWRTAHQNNPGATPDPWWTEALAAFQPKINARAQQLKQADTAAGKPLLTDAKYRSNAEEEFGPALGVDAYQLWAGKYNRQAPSVTLIGGKNPPAAYTYKGWVKAGEPARVTTQTDDTVVYASTEKIFGRTRNQVKQVATDYTIWTGAEKAFKIRIGHKLFAEWNGSLNRSLGTEDTYFSQANSFYKNQIADGAFTIFKDPSSRKLPPFLQKRMMKGATVEFWLKNKADFDNLLLKVSQDWTSAKRPRLAYWKDAVQDLDPQIKAHETVLQNQAVAGGKKLTKPLKQQIRKEAEEKFAFDITKRVFERWSANPNPRVKYAGDWQNAKTTRESSFTEPAYQKWADAGRPSGWRNVPWVLARRSVLKADTRTQGVLQYGDRFGGWIKDLTLQTAIRTRQRGGAFNSIGFRQHAAQTWGSVKAPLKAYGIVYATVNGFGLFGWLLTNHAVAETRTSGVIKAGDAEAELIKLLQNSEYVDNNYRNKLLGGIPLGDTWYQADGHLMAFVDPQTKEVVYFRRIPSDLVRAVAEQAGKRTGDPSLYKPWVGTSLDNQFNGVHAFVHDGQVYIFEPMKLSGDGGLPVKDIDPLTGANPTALPAELKEQIGVRAYQAWVKAGRPQGTAAAALWQQAEAGFLTQSGEPAYKSWVAAGRPTGGENSHWGDIRQSYQQRIDAEALRLWKQDKKQGDNPSQEYKLKAEGNLGPQIALDVYGRWNETRTPRTVGIDQWLAGEPELQAKVGAPAFDAWAKANRLVDGANSHWKTAVNDWKADGMPIMQKVAIRAPYRVEGNVDWNKPSSHETGPYGLGGSMGRRDRFIAAAGPIEGWRLHANLELLGNYRYSVPTASTVRVQGPSPTQGWGWDVRQQDTTFWSRVNLSIGSIEYNGAQVYDLTDKSRNGWSVMNTRLYLDLGNRNREQLDMTGKFFRARETGFAELGLGADFVKVTVGDKTFNLNGYYELQAYAPDFRAQLNWKNGPITNVRGIEPFPPALGIDPALQFTISYNPWKVTPDVPYFSEPVR
jgi:hypothetical protein